MTVSRTLCLCLLLVAVACTPPPRLLVDDLPTYIRSTLHIEPLHTFTASGKAAISINGDVHAGTVDVLNDSAGKFAASFYGPLGVMIASVTADSAIGCVSMEKIVHSFRRDQTMDTLPFAWSRKLTVNDLIAVFSGTMPDSMAAILENRPDSTQEKKKTINIVWNTDILKVTATIRKKKNNVESVVFEDNIDGAWSIKLAAIKQGRAFKIELREDDRNYFSITYEKIRNN